jgi:hypothetical protein
MNENDKKLARLRETLEVRGNGKCYFPCYDYRGFQNRIFFITTTQRHCREKGHAEGGYEYRPLVRGFIMSCILCNNQYVMNFSNISYRDFYIFYKH